MMLKISALTKKGEEVLALMVKDSKESSASVTLISSSEIQISIKAGIISRLILPKVKSNVIQVWTNVMKEYGCDEKDYSLEVLLGE